MTVKEFAGFARSPIEIRSGYNNKLFCKAYNNKKHSAISDREIISVRSEIRSDGRNGYSNYARPIICVFVDGAQEYKQAVTEAPNE